MEKSSNKGWQVRVEKMSNPDVVESQIVGMAMQGVSRVLLEGVQFSQTNVTSLDWNSYPVLRFGAHPNITAIVITNTGPPLGAGEG